MTDPTTGPDPDLLEEALIGLFEISREDATEVQNLREHIARLPSRQRRALLEEVVSVDRFQAFLEKAKEGEPLETPGTHVDDEHVEKIDAVLSPLARLEGGDAGEQALLGLARDERVHVLFDSIGRR